MTSLQTWLVSVGLCSFCPRVLFWSGAVQTIEGSVLQIRGELNRAASVDCLSRFRGCGCIQLWREAFLADRVSRYRMIPPHLRYLPQRTDAGICGPVPATIPIACRQLCNILKCNFLYFRNYLTDSRLISRDWMQYNKCCPGSKPTAWLLVGILIYSGPCTVQVNVAVHDELVFCAKDSCVSKAACIMAVLLILL